MSTIIIAPYQAADLDQMMEIEVLSFALPWTRQSYEDLAPLDTIKIWVAKQGGEVVGYMLYQFWGDEMELHSIAVNPVLRRKGIGTLLVEHMLTQAASVGIKRIYLLVRPSNAAALALYRKYGFEVVGVRHKYYHDNSENALIMCRNSEAPNNA